MVSFFAVIDLIAIAPFYIPFFTYDLRFVRLLRMFRILRILKLERYTSAISTIKKVFSRNKAEFYVFTMLFTVISTMSSLLIYFMEHEAQPDAFATMLDALGWSIETLTTVGSDLYPITLAGKFFASVVSILGIGMIALPTSILTIGFTRKMIKRYRIKSCPHCGKKI